MIYILLSCFTFLAPTHRVKNNVKFGTKNNIKFDTKPILGFLLNFPSFLFVVLILSLFLDEILMPRGSPPIMHDAFYWFVQDASCRFPYFLFCRAQNVRWFGGIIVRGCALRSLLGSYIHQELI